MAKPAQTQTITVEQIEALIKRAEDSQLSPADDALVINLSRLVLTLLGVLDDKNTSLAKLKKLLFGPKSEKRKRSQTQPNPNQPSTVTVQPVNEPSQQAEPVEKKRRRGHGRLGTKDFPGAQVISCINESLKSGDNCPHQRCRGNLRDTNDPSILIKRVARPVIDAIKYERQVLRCTRCEDRFTANLPENVSEEKFDVTADAMIVISHYRTATPFYRLAQVQSMMGVPLPASTQFERAESVANRAHPIFLELERQAARSGLIHGDDTGVRILSLIKENEQLSQDDRKGMYTTGIGARSGEFDIVLYRSGRRYCGENLDALFAIRPDDLTPPILMADAENKNWSKKFRAILAKCLAHGRRKFVDCSPAFRVECGVVLDMLAQVYQIDAKTKEMTAQQRLAYHQEHSKPIMDKLKTWITEQITVHKKEPNSSLGKAINYMLKHWQYLTRFLEVAGCPLDNNFIERSLRRAVILRKNSLFFKTEHGAAIGDVLLSLIETCELNKANVFDYLVTVMNNSRAVRAQPALWLPWNYQLQKVA